MQQFYNKMRFQSVAVYNKNMASKSIYTKKSEKMVPDQDKSKLRGSGVNLLKFNIVNENDLKRTD